MGKRQQMWTNFRNFLIVRFRKNLRRKVYLKLPPPLKSVAHFLPKCKWSTIQRYIHISDNNMLHVRHYLFHEFLLVYSFFFLILTSLYCHYHDTWYWPLTHSIHLSQHLCTYMHIVYFVCCFIYYFNCISFSIRLSGGKVAIKLIDRPTYRLTGWILKTWCKLICGEKKEIASLANTYHK